MLTEHQDAGNKDIKQAPDNQDAKVSLKTTSQTQPTGHSTEGASTPNARKSRGRHSRSYIATQQANAKRREREEWDRTRGAGSHVLLWYEDLRVRRSPVLEQFTWGASDVVPPLEEVLTQKHDPQEVIGMDRLLDWGLCEYTILPKTLGRGRFSTVYLAVKNGQRFAVKHTPLFPHHELVATRLLREPTLLAELPPHPNLVDVVETIRTPGHFYLVEEYLDGYVTLEALVGRLGKKPQAPSTPSQSPPPGPILPDDVAEKVFDQLVLALRAIHTPLRVCHRDVKPENVLVHPETLHLKLLDFGLATHFSRSHAKLTTCCGSPAFHCPEIVTALSQPPGTVAYWGPEVDAWTCGVTLLRCLTGVRYPLGTSHTSPSAMGHRAKKILATIPDTPLRKDITALLDIHGERRMESFERIAKRIHEKLNISPTRVRRELKCTSFVPAPPQHAMVLPLLLTKQIGSAQPPDVPLPTEDAYGMITLLNTSHQPSRRVLSFIKYCLRCAGILYYTVPWPDPSAEPLRSPSSFSCIFQCVVELAQEETPGTLSQIMQTLWSMVGQRTEPEELVKLPARAIHPKARDDAVRPSSGPSGKQGPLRMLVFNLVVSFPRGTDTPLPQEWEAPTPEMVATALQHRLSTAVVPPSPKTSTWRGTTEEPDLRIDTHVDRLPPATIVDSPRSRRQSHSRTPKPSSSVVHVYVSDSRALPYVRGALSNGGVLKATPSKRDSAATSPTDGVQGSPRVRSGYTTPEPRQDLIGPHELSTSLDSIESLCRSLLERRTTPGRQDTDNAHARQLYTLVKRLNRRLEHSLLSKDSEALRRQMSELNFRALDVLGPALALVSVHDGPLHPDMPASSNTGSLALAVLERFSACSNAKEMCLGFQEQIERLGLAWRSHDDAAEQPAVDVATVLARDGAMLVQAVLGQLQRLANLFPAVRTRRPKALLDSVLGLLSPGVYQDVIADALSTLDEVDATEELATQATVVLCELVLGLDSMAQQIQGAERPHLGQVLVDGLYALIPFLPRATGRAQDHESALLCEQSRSAEGVSKRITVWNIVRKTYDQLHLDMGTRCLGPADASRSARETLAGSHPEHDFVLLVHQLAYESLMSHIKDRSRDRLRVATQARQVLAEPRRWSADTARELLGRLAHVLPGALLPGLCPLDVPVSAHTLARTQDLELCDALVTFVQWAIDALPSEARTRLTLEEECVTYVVRGMALIANYASQPRLRAHAFEAVTRLVRDHSSDEVTLRLIREMMAPEAPAPLRGSTVHLVRELCAARLERLASRQSPNDELLADGRLWRAWNKTLFVLPRSRPEAPAPDDALAPTKMDDLANYLAQHQTYLQECCSLFYFVAVRDASHNYTGLREEREYARLYERFVQPLATWVAEWQAYVAKQAPHDPVASSLALLEMGIRRIQDCSDT
ncbi:hypothetical protein MEQU1_001329 [Malassezia equina]|uniref:Protein kinase domain-containing protein n=1 Tax=Malassezia equina TaxID=1381935 RepID=A0AAF0EDP6_9BASI|nr:hypothetical protein MEQU1_001329 [Malassezia equina]